MKKSNLVTGIAYAVAGILFLSLAIWLDNRVSGIFFGFAGAGIGPGLVMIYRYLYWNRPENRERYRERMENEAIQMHDELNVKLRDKAGRYCYVLGLLTISISMLVFSLLEAVGVLPSSRLIVLFLGGYLLFQIAAGTVIWNHLRKKY